MLSKFQNTFQISGRGQDAASCVDAPALKHATTRGRLPQGLVEHKLEGLFGLGVLEEVRRMLCGEEQAAL